MSWFCQCGNHCGSYDPTCPKCGASAHAQPTVGGAAPAPASEPRKSGDKVGTRYTDAYRVSGALVTFGEILKVIGVMGAILIFVLGLAATNAIPGAGGFIGGLIFAGLWFALFFVLGTLVSAQGQILRATLDSAVNTSPFLTDSEKANVMNVA